MSAILLSKLSLETNSQARVSTDEDTVAAYTEVIKSTRAWTMSDREKMVLFFDGETYFVGDGWHRLLAAGRAGKKSLPETAFDIRDGDAVDAMLYGMTAADTHGLRMTQKDKRRCVVYLLDNGVRGVKQTQVQIAELAGVNVRTVKRIVKERRDALSDDDDDDPGSSGEDDPSGEEDDNNGDIDPVDEAKGSLHRMSETIGRLLSRIDDVANDYGTGSAEVHSAKSIKSAKDLYDSLRKWQRAL